jgi:hypothetical protein
MPETLPRGLQVASALCLAWGVLLLLSAAAFAMPAMSGQSSFILPIVLASTGVALCVAGRGLAKQDDEGAWIALRIGTFLILLPLVVRATMSYVGAVVGIAVVALTWTNTRHLRRSGSKPKP